MKRLFFIVFVILCLCGFSSAQEGIFNQLKKTNGSSPSTTSSAVSNSSSASILFQFKQNEGDSLLHTSEVNEEAYLNDVLNNTTQFINRISTTVQEQNDDKSARLYTTYMTTQNTLMNKTGNHLSWGDENFVTTTRTINGKITDSSDSFLPTVFSVPSFPDKPLSPGDTWTSEGKEVHDFRELFNMKKAISIPFTAKYKYVRNEVIDNKELQVIEVSYQFYQNNSQANINNGEYYLKGAGVCKETIWWDNKLGNIDHYIEEFQIIFYAIDGTKFEFRGKAHGEVTEYKSVNNDDKLNEIQKAIQDLDNINITKGEKGLTISIENIQFEPDSDILLESEKIKLKKIAEILKQYKNDLLITGHCAARGTQNARQKLSEQRAQSVASYLIELDVRDEKHIFTQGKGSREPVASNNTEEGRSRNRRVEITIMD
ncbi:MAG: OmpA family protein [Treponema sp.]|nr:OmpA family protein [Treponema sp.]